MKAGADVDADAEGTVEVSTSSSSSSTGGDKYVMKYDIIGTPMRMVGVPTHFFKVRSPTTYYSTLIPHTYVKIGVTLRKNKSRRMFLLL